MKLSILLVILLSLTSFESLAYGWQTKADFPAVARHRTTAISIGNHIYVGLGHYNGAGPNILFEDWWEYDPATNAWSQKANYPGGPTYHASAFSINGIGYVGTGRIDFPSVQLVKKFYSYNPVTNIWTQEQDFPGSGRRGGVGFAVNGFGYMGTGSYNNDFYRFDPSSGTWSAIASMPTPGRISAVGFELDGFGYVGTGGVSGQGSSTDFWQYNPTTNQWTQKANVGFTNRQESTGFGLGGYGYILTGDNYSSGTNYKDMWEYNPNSNSWIQLEDFPGAARRYMSSITHNNVAYCGLGTSGTNYNDWWLFDRTLYLLEKNLDQLEMTVSPNPATDKIEINMGEVEGVNVEDLSLEIIALTGQKCKSINLNSSQMTVDISQLEKGNYLINLNYNNTNLKTKKLIIQ